MTGVYTDRNKPFWQPALRMASKLCVSCLPPEMVSQRMTQREDERNDFVCHTFGWACLSCDLGPLQLVAARIRLSYWVRMNEKTQTQQQGIRLGHAVEPEPIVKHRFRKNLLQKLCLPLWSYLCYLTQGRGEGARKAGDGEGLRGIHASSENRCSCQANDVGKETQQEGFLLSVVTQAGPAALAHTKTGTCTLLHRRASAHFASCVSFHTCARHWRIRHAGVETNF